MFTLVHNSTMFTSHTKRSGSVAEVHLFNSMVVASHCIMVNPKLKVLATDITMQTSMGLEGMLPKRTKAINQLASTLTN